METILASKYNLTPDNPDCTQAAMDALDAGADYSDVTAGPEANETAGGTPSHQTDPLDAILSEAGLSFRVDEYEQADGDFGYSMMATASGAVRVRQYGDESWRELGW